MVFKYQADLTLHLIKGGGEGKHHSLEKNFSYCSLGVEGQILSSGLISF